MSACVRAWLLACRPKTLFASVAPVALGTALAFSERAGHWGAALAALLGALSIQIGTNLANDYWDARKGADTAERLGPLRVTSAGLLQPRTVFRGMVAVFAVACAAGLYLVSRAGWPVVAIGSVSIACGILYTAGPFPLAYVGLGDVFTFVFFGLVATAGTYFVQALAITPAALMLGCVPGFYSVVLIALNNLRDRDTDVLANKRTSAVRFGSGYARAEIVCCLLAPAAVPLWMAMEGLSHWVPAGAAAAVCLLVGWPVASAVLRITDMRRINGLFPLTAAASLVMAGVISLLLFI